MRSSRQLGSWVLRVTLGLVLAVTAPWGCGASWLEHCSFASMWEGTITVTSIDPVSAIAPADLHAYMGELCQRYHYTWNETPPVRRPESDFFWATKTCTTQVGIYIGSTLSAGRLEGVRVPEGVSQEQVLKVCGDGGTYYTDRDPDHNKSYCAYQCRQ